MAADEPLTGLGGSVSSFRRASDPQLGEGCRSVTRAVGDSRSAAPQLPQNTCTSTPARRREMLRVRVPTSPFQLAVSAIRSPPKP
jgi:hypothetical protein